MSLQMRASGFLDQLLPRTGPDKQDLRVRVAIYTLIPKMAARLLDLRKLTRVEVNNQGQVI